MNDSHSPTGGNQPEDFDLSKLRLNQAFAAELGAKKVLNTVPIRKPDRQTFIRVHKSAEFRFDTAILESKADRECYLVDADLWASLSTEIHPVTLFTSITRQGVLFLWPVRLPGPDGKWNDWSRSAYQAAELAMGRWVRVSANMGLGAYELLEATADIPEPTWPEKTFQQLVEVAFKNKFIRSLDHPVIKQLRGEA